MIRLLLSNPYVLLFGVLSLLGAFGGYSWWMYNKGYNARTSEYETAQNNAENTAAINITKTKKDAQIVYKYIQSQNNDCSIYSNVIDRLPEPSTNSR